MKYGENICPVILEPLSFWRYWINGFAAALRVAAALSQNRFPAVHDWVDAISAHEETVPPSVLSYLEESSRSLTEEEGGQLIAAVIVENDRRFENELKAYGNASDVNVRFAEAHRSRIMFELIRIDFFQTLNEWHKSRGLGIMAMCGGKQD